MSRRIGTTALAIDWTRLAEVIELATRFGADQVVFKHNDRTTYNITHLSRRDRWDLPDVTVFHTTRKEG